MCVCEYLQRWRLVVFAARVISRDGRCTLLPSVAISRLALPLLRICRICSPQLSISSHRVLDSPLYTPFALYTPFGCGRHWWGLFGTSPEPGNLLTANCAENVAEHLLVVEVIKIIGMKK